MLSVPNNVHGYRTLRTPAAVKFGPTDDAGFDGLNYNPVRIGTVVSVGLVEGPISISQNPETSTRMSSQLYNPYDIDLIFQAWQVTLSIDQIDVYNLALQISSAQASIGIGQSVVAIRGREYFAGLKSMEVETDGSRTSATGALTTQKFQFFKVKVFQNGAIELGRETQTRLPLICHCLANDDDIVGQITLSSKFGSAPGYE